MKKFLIAFCSVFVLAAGAVAIAAQVDTSVYNVLGFTYGGGDGWYQKKTDRAVYLMSHGVRQEPVGAAYYEDFEYGDGKGIQTLQLDGTAYDSTALAVNMAYFGSGNALAYTAIVAETIDIDMDATGLDIGADQTANDGFELWGGTLGASGRPFIIGDDPAFKFCVGVNITDIDGSDEFHIGFRRAETVNATFDNYLDLATIGFVTAADPAALATETINDNAATTTTTLVATLDDAVTTILCVLVSGAGAVTYTIDGAADANAVAFSFDDGDPVIPFIHYLQDTALADAIYLTSWEVAYQ